MKNGKRPTLRQKKLIQALGMNPEDWFVVMETPMEMHIVHRRFDSVWKVIVKGAGA